MNYTDEDIVTLVLEGEKEYFERLVQRYQRPIFNLMFRYSGSREEAADLTQDVFIRAFDKLHSFNIKKNFFSWLYSVALNRAKDWMRKNSRVRTLHNTIEHEAGESQITTDQHFFLESREDHEIVKNALMGLPSQTREMLIMRYQHGSSVREVATVFEMSESAVKMRVKRALAQLKLSIEETQSRRNRAKENGNQADRKIA